MTELDRQLAHFREQAPAPTPDAAERLITQLLVEPSTGHRTPRRRPHVVASASALAVVALVIVALWPVGDDRGREPEVLAQALAAITPAGEVLHLVARETTTSSVVDAATGQRVGGPVVEHSRYQYWTASEPAPMTRLRFTDADGRVLSDTAFAVDPDKPEETTVTSLSQDRSTVHVDRQVTVPLPDPIQQIRSDLETGSLALAGRAPDGALRLRRTGGPDQDYEVHVDPVTYAPRREIERSAGFVDNKTPLPVGPGQRAWQVITTEFTVNTLPDGPAARAHLQVREPVG
jgi:hypothetical protein